MSLTVNFKNSNSGNFRKIFYFFSQYWEIVNKRGTEYSGLAVTVATSFIFDILRVEYLNSPDELNPNNFIYFQAAYLEELKNYYTQKNG